MVVKLTMSRVQNVPEKLFQSCLRPGSLMILFRSETLLREVPMKKGALYLGIAQIAIAPPPFHSNGHSGALVFGHYFYHFEGLYASGNGNIWSAFIQQ